MKLVSFVHQGNAFYVNPQFITLVEDGYSADSTKISVVGIDHVLYADEPVSDVVRKIQDALLS